MKIWMSGILPLLLVFSSTAQAGLDPRPGPEPEIRAAIVLFDGVQIIDFAAPYEVFGTAGFGVVTVSSDGGPVKTEMGLSVTPDFSFADVPDFDLLVVPGGTITGAERDPAMLNFVRERSASSRHVFSICTGSFILAGAGLLDGLQATTYTQSTRRLASRYPAVNVVNDVRWTDNGKFITSAGLASGIDASLHVVARVRGVERARSVAMHLEYDWSPHGGFVRSRMADRHIPRELDTEVDWPEGLNMHRLVHAGDTDQWRMRWHVEGADAGDVMARIAKAMDAVEGWSRIPESASWRGRNEDQQLLLVLALPDDGAEGQDLLELRIETVAQAKAD